MIGSTRYVARAEIARQSQLSAEMAKLQQSISTGKRISVASDDPIASGRISEIRQTQADHVVWTSNAGTGSSVASAADTALTSVATLIDRAKELVLSGRNEATSTADRTTLAAELRGLAANVTSYAQSADTSGRALFPTDTPLAIPVSGTLSLTATASRDTVFGAVATQAGTRSIADILTGAADALGVVDTTARGTATTTSIADIDAAAASIDASRADQGLRAQRFEDATARLANGDTALTSERQDLENTDMSYALATYSAKDTALQAAQAVFAKSHSKSLFDLLG